MAYTPITPFRRPVDAALIERITETAEASLPADGVNKWEVLRELGAGRTRLGVTDRELTVLQALLSFHPGAILGGPNAQLIVHPSNASISERLNGMPCSTLRRHLANLVKAGLLIRRDSPNGKRFVRRGREDPQVFGFDLTPLVSRYSEFCSVAETVRAEEEAIKRQRQQVSLMCRDLRALIAFGQDRISGLPIWDQFVELAQTTRAAMRRSLDGASLTMLIADLTAALDEARDVIEDGTINSSANDAQSERHYQNSKEDSYDSEKCLETLKGRGAISQKEDEDGDHQVNQPRDDLEDHKLPSVPLSMVLACCLEIRAYTPNPIRHWHECVQAAELVRPMIGISPSAWSEAIDAMGPEEAAVAVLAILERFDEIRNPGGYLRHLARRARKGEFSSGPMIGALLNREKRAA